METIGEISEYMKNMGDVIVSGGEAFNLYVDFKERIVTSDIDAKFVPRMPVNPQYFGKLQATKLITLE
jgi:peptidase E